MQKSARRLIGAVELTVLFATLGFAAAPSDPATHAAAIAPAQESRYSKLRGTVESFDAAAHTLHVKAADGTQVSLNVGANARLFRLQTKIGPADIRTGDRIKILRYEKLTNEVMRLVLY